MATPLLPELGPIYQDRIIGTLFGSALGDAVGLYTEFLSGDQSEQAYPTRRFTLSPSKDATPFKRDWHRAPHHVGDWTDDTDHALLILLSFLHSNGQKLDPNDLAVRLKTWVDMGLRALDTVPLGLGATVGRIVQKSTYLDNPEAVARDVWTRGKRNLAPNGSVMRTHPLGLMCLDKTVEETFEIAARFSSVTHVDPRCILACAVGTALVRGLVRGEVSHERHIDEMLEAGLAWYNAWWSKQRALDPARDDDPPIDVAELDRYARAKDLKALALDEGSSIGYVYKTFGSGLLLLRQAMSVVNGDDGRLRAQTSVFESLVTPLVMEGGDADTNACFAGALLGAYLGYKVLPPHWRDGLRHGAWLLEKGEGLCQTVGVTKGKYRGSADPDTAHDGSRGFLSVKEMDAKWAGHREWMEAEEGRLRREEETSKKGWMSWGR
ncbi:ADP-ribosylglycohydrolase-domain-containing protein [Plectosphaerella plurivora]|uniref:ADP-ribosylglycohydrolase-domain-containing protein n=1 Tax=Plectosphaerella plurivora TaxID=936078 RepID=A0A9P9ADF0_9PEZI|nr:ADP-ribosylglycohydrolase-domain-containing protein [Plectosphaerella plurivora]